MSKSNLEQIREFVTENFLLGRTEPLSDDASFLDEGIIDSTGVLELVAFVEQRFNLKVKDEELTTDNLDTITSVANYVARKHAAVEVNA
jgi:acyl carrier protein